MEAYKDYTYSSEELIKLIRNSKSKELKQYYYELLFNNNINLFQRISWKYKNISYHSYDDLLQYCFLAMIKSIEWYNENLSPFKNFLALITDQYLFCKVNSNSSTREKAEKKKLKCISLYQEVLEDGEGGKQTFADILPCPEAQRQLDAIPEAVFIDSLRESELRAINKLLSSKEKQVVTLYYFGDDNNASYNTSEIAEKLNVNKSRAMECLHNSYRKLRKDSDLRKFYHTEFEGR